MAVPSRVVPPLPVKAIQGLPYVFQEWLRQISLLVPGLLDVVGGGTGQTSFPLGSILYGNNANSIQANANLKYVSGSSTLEAPNILSNGTLQGDTVKCSNAAGYISSDGSTGFTGTVTTASLVGKTITIKDGIITGFS